MVQKTTISSTNEEICEVVLNSISPRFIKSGDFFKLIENIKKNNYSRKSTFFSFFNEKAKHLENVIKHDYPKTINLIEAYFKNNPNLIEAKTSVYDLQPKAVVSHDQICSMAENFSTFSGMSMSSSGKFVSCIAKKTSLNRYNRNDHEGWDPDHEFYKYHCKVQTNQKSGKTICSKINKDIVKDNLDVALFEERTKSFYSFEGLFSADKIFDENEKPFFKLQPKLNKVNELIDELEDTTAITQEDLYEGKAVKYKGIRYERNPEARQRCIDAKGSTCSICGFNFSKSFGEAGQGYIHVHHVVPLNKRPKPYKINPEKDLIPVCPNCHAMLHKLDCTPDHLKQLLKKSSL